MTRVGQFTVPPSLAVHRAAAAVAKNTQSGSQAAGIVPGLRQGTVVSYDGGTPPSCTVTFDGTTNVPGVQYMSSYFPTAGDLVSCLTLNGTTQILGQLAATPAVTPAGTDTATVVTYDGGTPPTCTVTFDGVNNISGVRFAQGIAPKTGDLLECIFSAGTFWAVGKKQAVKAGLNYTTVSKSTTTSLTSGSWTTIIFDDVSQRDDDGTFYDNSTGRFATMSLFGLWLFTVTLNFAAQASAGTMRAIRGITAGGSDFMHIAVPGVASTAVNVTLTGMVQLSNSAGYYVYFQGWQDSGTTMTMAAHAVGTPCAAAGILLQPYW